MTEKQFVEMIGPLATADMQTSGILASITAAQACLESGYGSTDLARNANNLFGMKCSLSGNTWTSVWDGKSKYAKQTAEQTAAGKEYFVTADFRKYPGISNSIRDHSLYLSQAKNGSKLRYAGLTGCTDYRRAAQLIKDGGYATDTKYVAKICSLIERWNLTQYDQKGKTSMNINKEFISRRNINGTGNPCEFIVVHETDNTTRGANARAHASAQCNGHFTNMSVHYYVDKDGVCQAAEHTCKCWHVGRSYVSNPNVTGCSNNNSIGIEICVPSDGDYSKARQNAIELVRYLIQTTGIPANRVIRHHDAKGKYCPRKMLDNPALWTDFKNQIGSATGTYAPGASQAADKYYRVGTDWKNGICTGQIGAYTSLDNAKASCQPGYKAYDSEGRVVYTAAGGANTAPAGGDANALAAQTALNRSFGANLILDGKWGQASQKAWNMALQTVLNVEYNAGITVDGIIGPKTRAAIRTVRLGDNGLLVGVLQIGLYARGYTTGGIDCSFGPATKVAVEKLQAAKGLVVDALAGVEILTCMSTY